MAKQETKDTLKNFGIDFEKLKNDFNAYGQNILEISAIIYFTYHPKGSVKDSYHSITLRDGMRSCADFNDISTKKADVRIEYFDGKIILRERSSPGSISYNKKGSWDSLESFKKGFGTFLHQRIYQKKRN